MNASLFLEILNGGAVTPELLCLVLLGIYLSKESRRRGLRWFNWFDLPPSMNLILAMFIFDAGVWSRSVIIWSWRRFTVAPNFNRIETVGLIVGGLLIVLGSLCKIRALTRPDHGDGPWLAASAGTVTMIGVLLLFR